jgi:hypothetical protein
MMIAVTVVGAISGKDDAVADLPLARASPRAPLRGRSFEMSRSPPDGQALIAAVSSTACRPSVVVGS